MNVHAVHVRETRRIVIRPGHVVVRAGGEDRNLGVRRQSLGDIARVQLGAAVDIGAIPLNHDGKLHWSGSPARSLGRLSASWKSDWSSDPLSAGPPASSKSATASAAEVSPAD